MEPNAMETPLPARPAIATAMILAAGLGTRMRHLSAERPKPLTEVAGRSLIDRVADRCVEAGVRRAVVNTHYMAEMIENHLSARRDIEIVFSREDKLLDTAGGTANARKLLGDGPIFAINSDALWMNGPQSALTRLAAAFDPDSMDFLLLMHRMAQLPEHGGRGDFHMDALGRLKRRKQAELSPYIYAGVQVLSPAVLDAVPPGTALSFNPLWDKSGAAGRLFGQVHDGSWYHIGTPEALAGAALEISTGRAWYETDSVEPAGTEAV
jgi:MurNAc alpha-1-phosphate uridylyltransferase